MALTFAAALATKFASRAIRDSFASPCAITIYSGAKPSAATIAANWAAYTSSNAIFLAHYSGAVWGVSTNLVFLSTVPAAVNPINNGDATWAILWTTNPLLASMNGAIPTTSFIVVTVGNLSSLDPVRFSNITMSTATPVAINDASVQLAIGAPGTGTLRFEYSAAARTALLTRWFSASASFNQNVFFITDAGTVSVPGTTLLVLGTGAVPNPDTLVSYTTLGTQRAIGWNLYQASMTDYLGLVASIINEKYTFSTPYNAVVNAGTLTWFGLLRRWWGSGSPTAQLSDNVIGTIGAIGSGADIEMFNPVVTVGQQVRVIGLSLAVPTSWSW